MQPQLPTVIQQQKRFMIFHMSGQGGNTSSVVSTSREMICRACFVIQRSLHSLLKSTSQSATVEFFFCCLDFSLGIAFIPLHMPCSWIVARANSPGSCSGSESPAS